MGKFFSSVTWAVLVCLTVTFAVPANVMAGNNSASVHVNLPVPGTMVSVTAAYNPAVIRGLTIYPDNPFEFDFIVSTGDDHLQGDALNDESTRLIKYFLASLTVPEDQMWVNLSPYEKNRIIPDDFGQTEMGRDLLAQDYLLKQLSASLMYPEDDLGKAFWDRVYKKAYQQFGTTDIPLNTFNKVWIIPAKADVYVKDNSVYVVNSHLKVMLEEDYLALEMNQGSAKHGLGDVQEEDLDIITGVTAEVVREILIPEIEHEINHGKTFANLRQIYNSMILAAWYKKNLKQSLLTKAYVNQAKTAGIEIQDPEINQKIYEQYVQSFKKGVYNYIKEDRDPVTDQLLPRKYFSGGVDTTTLDQMMKAVDTADIDDIDVSDERNVRVHAKLIDALKDKLSSAAAGKADKLKANRQARIPRVLQPWFMFYRLFLSKRVSVQGLENLPRSGSFIMAGNHLGNGLDGLLLVSEIYLTTGRMPMFLVRSEQKSISPFLQSMLQGVADWLERHNIIITMKKKYGISGLRKMVNVFLDKEAIIGLYPGADSWEDLSGVDPDEFLNNTKNWKVGFARIAKKFDLLVVPFREEGNFPSELKVTFGAPVYPNNKEPVEILSEVKQGVLYAGADIAPSVNADDRFKLKLNKEAQVDAAMIATVTGEDLASEQVLGATQEVFHLDWENALNNPWPELTRSPDQPEPTSGNAYNYLKNQKDLRPRILMLLMQVEMGDIDFEGFIEGLSELHKVSLLSIDETTPYVPSSYGAQILADITEESVEIKLREMRYVAGKYKGGISKEVFSRLRTILSEQYKDETLEKKVLLISQFYADLVYTGTVEQHPFSVGSNSLSMNIANALLRLIGLEGISHHNLDQMYIDGNEQYGSEFLLTVQQANPDVDFSSSTPVSDEAIIVKLDKQAVSNARAEWDKGIKHFADVMMGMFSFGPYEEIFIHHRKAGRLTLSEAEEQGVQPNINREGISINFAEGRYVRIRIKNYGIDVYVYDESDSMPTQDIKANIKERFTDAAMLGRNNRGQRLRRASEFVDALGEFAVALKDYVKRHPRVQHAIASTVLVGLVSLPYTGYELYQEVQEKKAAFISIVQDHPYAELTLRLDAPLSLRMPDLSDRPVNVSLSYARSALEIKESTTSVQVGEDENGDPIYDDEFDYYYAEPASAVKYLAQANASIDSLRDIRGIYYIDEYMNRLEPAQVGNTELQATIPHKSSGRYITSHVEFVKNDIFAEYRDRIEPLQDTVREVAATSREQVSPYVWEELKKHGFSTMIPQYLMVFGQLLLWFGFIKSKDFRRANIGYATYLVQRFYNSFRKSNEDDKAMVSEEEKAPGGIDLNPAALQLNEQGETIRLNIPDHSLENQNININGLVPVIINVTPVSSLPLLLGLEDKQSPNDDWQVRELELLFDRKTRVDQIDQNLVPVS